MKTRIVYIENKETGEARIGKVTYSRTFQTVYYRGKTLQRSKSGGVKGNFFDVESNEEYWVSGCKKKGGDSHWASKVPVIIDDDVKEEYWTKIRGVAISQ